MKKFLDFGLWFLFGFWILDFRFCSASTDNQTVHLITLSESTYITSPSAVLDFANYLYETEDYAAAAIEYERALFLVSPDTERIMLQLGRTYLHLNNRNLASEYFSKLKTDTTFALLGFSSIEKNNLDSAKYFFSCINNKELQNKLNVGYSTLLQYPHKSPLLAGFLSTVIPGVGRTYAGRGKDGLFSFIFTAGSLALSCYYYEDKNYTVAGIFGGAGILFYSGDIYGSIESARIYNRKAFEDKLTKFKNDFNSFF